MDARIPNTADDNATAPECEARGARRVPIHLRAGFRKRGMTRADGELLDLSAQGFRIDTTCVLVPGMEVWLSLPGFEPRMATVAWTEGFQAGCKFDQPFNDSVMASFLARNGFA